MDRSPECSRLAGPLAGETIMPRGWIESFALRYTGKKI